MVHWLTLIIRLFNFRFFFFWGTLKEKVYSEKIRDPNHLRECIVRESALIDRDAELFDSSPKLRSTHQHMHWTRRPALWINATLTTVNKNNLQLWMCDSFIVFNAYILTQCFPPMMRYFMDTLYNNFSNFSFELSPISLNRS